MTLFEQLQALSDQAVLKSADRAVQNERESTSTVLHHFREVNRRRLYTLLKCGSLREWAMKIQKYPEDYADKRIAAMKLLEQIPELEEKIERGDLNLTQMGIANAFFNQQAKEGNAHTTEQKKKVLAEISGCSTRATQAKLANRAPNKRPVKETEKLLGNGRVDFRCELQETTLAKLKKLKSKHAHKKFTTDELINFLCDQALEEKPAPRRPKEDSKAETLRRVWNRDMHKCTNCGSDHALQVDHVIPRAKGGQDTLENLRLLCRNCNQRAAIELLGQDKMDAYINRKIRCAEGASSP
jgi:hypothetical protein